MLKLSIHEINPEHKKELYDWGDALMSQYNEQAVQTLHEENVDREAMFVADIDGTEYIIGIADVQNGKTEQPADMSRAINKKHRSVLDSVLQRTGIATGDLIYDISQDAS